MDSIQPVLAVRSVDDSVQWYERVLHFTTSFRNEREQEPESVNYAVLDNRGAGLHLALERDMENVAGQGAFNLITRDFDEIHRRAMELDVSFFIEVTEIPTGQRSFGVKDPGGNLITLAEAVVGT